jgi:hypothetical protein
MTYPTLTDAAVAFGIGQATLVEQMRRLERDIGARLFHRATPASETQRPTPRGRDLLHALAAHGIHGPEIEPTTPLTTCRPTCSAPSRANKAAGPDSNASPPR